MRGIRAKGTKPEMAIRCALHAAGFRYRLHVKTLPGKPDIVLPRYRTAIQVRGCFWHRHTCNDGHVPKSNRGYWSAKLSRNVERDSINDKRLAELGWKVLSVWECECTSQKRLAATVGRIIDAIRQ